MLNACDIRERIQDGMIDPGTRPAWCHEAKLWNEMWKERVEFIEDHSFDLTLANVFKLDGKGLPYVGREHRVTPNILPVQQFEPTDPGSPFRLYRGEYYLLQTQEALRLPIDVAGFLSPRTTLFRSGVRLDVGPVPPGFDGKLTLGCEVRCLNGFLIEPGARFVTVRFLPINPSPAIAGESYNGIWCGDKVTTHGERERGY